MSKPKAVIYTRVSSAEQVENTSLDSQEKSCRAYAQQQGYEVVGVYREEGESAKVANRPKLIEMMNVCLSKSSEIKAVIVYKIDRLARNQLDHLTIRKKLQDNEVRFHSASEPIGDDPMGKAIEGILAVFAELDNAIKSECSDEVIMSCLGEVEMSSIRIR
ncbi:hypothetical protein COX05_01550 [candidate division WWE3 bacterium CG22_combo_CG10-13_8_21_14_all_39_12]|uniref:Resolvase/invertase-type recombinase catalytic domain-containing protein n=2 Tax=Katanobacteria TaxID=422282 RepID=A0A2M7X1S3_UNCKA|nr:MAG: hypothetical protein COX05_01550 [candidate division WWE3 bacterium CG22_combo_CG10-13_8_21_14_all_39_12]PJA40049.1 MAG: hypothetical protein CO179_03580 [candidate division WWE3 bacterium CG_4_9_14_3_um_filter_39_7]